jgi:hypothetical protein
MSTPIIQKEVKDLMAKYKAKSYREQIDLSIEHLDYQLKEQPLVILFHEMIKELQKMKSLI